MADKRGVSRTRNYATVVYLDSCADNWVDIIENEKVPVFISPLHDNDVNSNGDDKKPHYHVLVMFDSVKTVEQAKAFFEKFCGVGCEVVNSLRAYARYLCHLDNPEKAQYKIDDVVQFGGADYLSTISCSSDKSKSIREMIVYIEENDIVCFADLCLWCSQNKSDWFDCLINSGAYFIKEYIKSRAWKLYHKEEK